jgi:hypothetical protein
MPPTLRSAENEVIAAAEVVVHSYKARGGYTVPLSINLQRLAVAVEEWYSIVHRAALDSDTNGHDRSRDWPGEEGYSNEQCSNEVDSPAPQADERRACRTSTGRSKPGDEAQAATTARKKRAIAP